MHAPLSTRALNDKAHINGPKMTLALKVGCLTCMRLGTTPPKSYENKNLTDLFSGT
jgi:hypothetical protein